LKLRDVSEPFLIRGSRLEVPIDEMAVWRKLINEQRIVFDI